MQLQEIPSRKQLYALSQVLAEYLGPAAMAYALTCQVAHKVFINMRVLPARKELLCLWPAQALTQVDSPIKFMLESPSVTEDHLVAGLVHFYPSPVPPALHLYSSGSPTYRDMPQDCILRGMCDLAIGLYIKYQPEGRRVFDNGVVVPPDHYTWMIYRVCRRAMDMLNPPVEFVVNDLPGIQKIRLHSQIKLWVVDEYLIYNRQRKCPVGIWAYGDLKKCLPGELFPLDGSFPAKHQHVLRMADILIAGPSLISEELWRDFEKCTSYLDDEHAKLLEDELARRNCRLIHYYSGPQHHIGYKVIIS